MRTKGLLAFCPTRASLTVDIGYQLVLAVKVIEAGCTYARDNGFVSTGNQKVTFQFNRVLEFFRLPRRPGLPGRRRSLADSV
jgi:hypothetical protein